ncbi:microtubule-associated proteins 1A/1B light chain 3B-like [Dysidea avara]|uniref:microtubule-associated proteins 1A/1B light chain 3B-like n=1 Tax=Dysidea avara TaxID=196820 RepID=UPI00331F5893
MNRIVSPEDMASVKDGYETTSLPTDKRLLSFKERKSFESRKKDVLTIRKKHPNKIPIVVERSTNEKNLPELDKSKFLVPEELSMSQLVNIIRMRLQLRESQAFYLIIGKKTMVSNSLTLGEIYHSEKDTDGFIYMTYASQEVFG